jgi:hypothetical protein
MSRQDYYEKRRSMKEENFVVEVLIDFLRLFTYVLFIILYMQQSSDIISKADTNEKLNFIRYI